MKNNILMFFLISVVLISLIYAVGTLVYAHEEDSNATTTDDDEVEDITDEDVNKFPFDMGKFELKGRVTAVDVSAKTVSVNGLAVSLAQDAKIRRGNVRALEGVTIGDRVEMSGRIQDGKLVAHKVVVKGLAKAFGRSQEEIQKLRSEIEKRIQEILKQIEEIRRKIGSSGTATSTTQ